MIPLKKEEKNQELVTKRGSCQSKMKMNLERRFLGKKIIVGLKLYRLLCHKHILSVLTRFLERIHFVLSH